jgi:hypothetical protein
MEGLPFRLVREGGFSFILLYGIIKVMKKYSEEAEISERQIPMADFLKSYNKNMPESFPRATTALLKKFKEANASLFKNGELWSLDLHRKKIIDWLPLNSTIS